MAPALRSKVTELLRHCFGIKTQSQICYNPLLFIYGNAHMLTVTSVTSGQLTDVYTVGCRNIWASVNALVKN